MSIDDHLPLRPNWLHILLSLADGPLHGYAIMQEVRERTDGKLRLWPATLYGTLHRLEAEGLLVPTSDPDDGQDERRSHYQLSALGREVLSAEVQRLDALVRLARTKGAVLP